MFLGLPSDAATPSARRAALLALPDASLVAQLVDLALRTREAARDAVGELAAAVSLPVAELIASPFGLRAIAMSAEAGARSLHQEYRADLPWPEAFVPPVSVQTDPHGYWDAGVLRSGKYRGFYADSPYATYNPNHMCKWGHHELMHRVVGVYWRPGITAWELYLSSRLNELVPVALWYGPDECMRLDTDGFDRTAMAKQLAAPEEGGAWWTEDEASLRERATRTARWLRWGVEHMDRELTAVAAERTSGQRVPAVVDHLDASSDALAYVVAHHARVTSERFEAFGALALSTGQATDDLDAYVARVENAFDRLLFGQIAGSAAGSVAADIQEQHALHIEVMDTCWRLAHHDRVPIARSQEALSAAGAMLRQDELTGASVDAWRSAAFSGVPSSAARAVEQTGAVGAESVEEIREGLVSIAPALAEWLDDTELLDPMLAVVVAQPWQRRPLIARLEAALPSVGVGGPALALWQLEVGFASARLTDEDTEHLSLHVDALPDSLEALEGGHLWASKAFEVVSFDDAIVAAHAAWAAGEPLALPSASAPASSFLLGHVAGSVALVPAPRHVSDVWMRLRVGQIDCAGVIEALDEIGEIDATLPDCGGAWIEEWVAAGAAGWAPRV
ncbi:MAG: hypothetical protein ACI82G_002461 [Bradymonadia bacterium]|jgi:hypothetical protein